MRVTLAEDTEAASRSVLDVSVNTPWSEIADTLDTAEAITDDAKVVSNAENSLVRAFQTDTRDHQLDLAHVPHTLATGCGATARSHWRTVKRSFRKSLESCST